MRVLEFFRLFKSPEHRRAFAIAAAADALQIGLFPLFAPGALNPAVTVTDIGAALVLSKVLGWHWAFLPTMVAELVPGLDLFPTWTAAVLYVAWERARIEPSDSGPGAVPGGGRVIDIETRR